MTKPANNNKERKQKSNRVADGVEQGLWQSLRSYTKQQIQMLGVVAIIVVVVGGSLWYVVDQTIQGEAAKNRPPANPAEQVIPDEGRGHIEAGSVVNYAHYPPSSGQHYPATATVGTLYEQPVADGYWLHNLEHGDIAVLYNCPTNCDALKNQIKALLAVAPTRRCGLRRILAVPYSKGMATPLSVLAWGRQLDLVEFDEEAILNFYKRYEDRGPEFLPCT